MGYEKHQGGFKYRNRRNVNRSGSNTVLNTIFTAIAGLAVKDLTSENSKIKFLYNKIFHSKQITNKQNDKKVIEGDYSVLNNELSDHKEVKNLAEK